MTDFVDFDGLSVASTHCDTKHFVAVLVSNRSCDTGEFQELLAKYYPGATVYWKSGPDHEYEVLFMIQVSNDTSWQFFWEIAKGVKSGWITIPEGRVYP
jgi:hypothetical protein